jgi:hypothetical protein
LTGGRNGLLGSKNFPGLKLTNPLVGVKNIGGIGGGVAKMFGGLTKVISVGMGKIIGFVGAGIGKLAAAVTGPIGLAVTAIIALCSAWDKLANSTVKNLDKMA